MARETLDRKSDGVEFRWAYCRANGSDVIFRTSSVPLSSNEGVNPPTDRLADLWLREVIHLLNENFVVVCDRVTVSSDYRLASTDVYFPFHGKNQSTTLGGNVYRMDVGTKRRYRKLIESYPGPIYQNIAANTLPQYSGSGEPKPTSWVEMVRFPGPVTSLFMTTTLEFTNTSSGATGAVPINQLPSSFGFGTMRGVSIDLPAGYKTHVMFSAEEFDSTPAPIHYHVTKGTDQDRHIVTGLEPYMEYYITPEDLFSGEVKYTIVPQQNVKYRADQAGVLEFDHQGLANQTVPNSRTIEIDDASTEDGSEDELTMRKSVQHINIDDYKPGKTPLEAGIGSDDELVINKVSAGVVSQSVNISDFSPDDGSEDELTINRRSGVQLEDVFTFDDELSMEVISIYLPPGKYSEKIIRPASPYLWPNEDRGGNFCIATPNDGILWNKVRGGDDSTVIRFGGLNAGFLPSAQASFGLDDPSGFARNVRTIRFGVRVVDVTTTAEQPIVVLKLRGANGVPRAQHNFPLQIGSSEVYLLHSPGLSIDMSAEQMRAATLSIEPRAYGAYGTQSYNFDFAEIYVEILSYDPPEKVIR